MIATEGATRVVDENGVRRVFPFETCHDRISLAFSSGDLQTQVERSRPFAEEKPTRRKASACRTRSRIVATQAIDRRRGSVL